VIVRSGIRLIVFAALVAASWGAVVLGVVWAVHAIFGVTVPQWLALIAWIFFAVPSMRSAWWQFKARTMDYSPDESPNVTSWRAHRARQLHRDPRVARPPTPRSADGADAREPKSFVMRSDGLEERQEGDDREGVATARRAAAAQTGAEALEVARRTAAVQTQPDAIIKAEARVAMLEAAPGEDDATIRRRVEERVKARIAKIQEQNERWRALGPWDDGRSTPSDQWPEWYLAKYPTFEDRNRQRIHDEMQRLITGNDEFTVTPPEARVEEEPS